MQNNWKLQRVFNQLPNKKNYIKGCDNFNLSYIAEHDSWKGKSKACNSNSETST